MGPLGAKVSKLESLKSPVTTKVERGLIRISSFSGSIIFGVGESF